MIFVAATVLSTILCGQVPYAPDNAQPGAVRSAGVQPASKPANQESFPNGAVFTIDNNRFDGPILSLTDGKVSIDSDPPEIVPLDAIERIEMSSIDSPKVVWIGQDNHDFVKDNATPGKNEIQDIHLQCSGLSPSRSFTQVVVTAIVAGAPQIWLKEPNNTPFWKIHVERKQGSNTADLYLEPPPADCFEQRLEITITLDDKRTIKSHIVPLTHTDSKLKAAAAAKPDDKSSPVLSGTIVMLARDQSIRGQLTAIEKENFGLVLSAGQRLDIPMSDVLGCWLGGEQAEHRKTFDTRLQAGGNIDWLLIMGKDKVAVPVEGTIQGLVDGKMEMLVAEETRKVSLDRVLGLVLATHPPRAAGDSFYQTVELASGERLLGRLIGVTPDSLQVHFWNSELKLPRGDVRSIVCHNGTATYLSDIEPVAVEEVPYFTRSLSYRRDQNLVGELLLVGGTKYRKGLAVHAKSVLTYSLDGRFESFRSRLGFDDTAPPGGSVACRVLADGRELFNNADLRPNVAAVPLDLDVTGAKQLVLEVDFGQFEDVGDRIIWAGAQVFRSKTPATDSVTQPPASPPEASNP